MFGGDWPVCKVANANYSEMFQLAEKLLENLSNEDREKVFGLNAIKFYNLKI